MSQPLADIQKSLRDGFHTDNLLGISASAWREADDSENPLPLFVLSRMFRMLGDYWEDRPLTVITANRMQAMVQPPIDDYLKAASTWLAPEVELEHLNKIVAAFVRWWAIQGTLKHGE